MDQLDRFEESIRRHVATRREEEATLLAQVDEAQTRIHEHQTVMEARSAEITARVNQLSAETKAAHRRIAPARGRVTAARRSGGVGAIANAEAHLKEVQAAFERISDANIAEGFRLIREGQADLSQLFALMKERDRPYGAWLDSMSQGGPNASR